MKIRRTVVLACAFAVAWSAASMGCWGKREIEERSFIHLMGIDKGEVERIHVTITIAVPRMMGPDSGDKGGENMGITLSSEGWDVTDALTRMESMSSRELTGMHLSCLILGEEFAKEDIAPIMDVFTRSIEFRPNTFVAVCRGSAGSFIKQAKAPEEMELADYITKLITTTHEHLGFCPLVTMHVFSMSYQTAESSPWAPLLSLAATTPAGKTETGAPAPHAAAEDLRPVVVTGAALFSLEGDKYQMVGDLGAEEVRAALLLAGESGAWYVDFQSPGEAEVASVIVRQSSLNTHVDRKGDSVFVTFRIRLSGSIEEFVVNPKAPPTTNEIRVAMTQTAQQRVEQLCKQSFNKMMRLRSDAIALGRSVQGTFLTQPEWDAFDWPSRLQDVVADFDIKVEIFSTGFSFQRAYPR